MTKTLSFAALLALLALISGFGAPAQQRAGSPISIETKNTSLILQADEGTRLGFLYYGAKLAEPSQFQGLRRVANQSTANGNVIDAYPCFGSGSIDETALRITHADGDLTTELVFAGQEESTPAPGIKLTTMRLKDKRLPLLVNLEFKAYYDEDVIAQRAVIVNNESAAITIGQCYSAYVPVQGREAWLSSFYGTWAYEMQMTESRLDYGLKAIESKRGVRTSQGENPSFILSLDMPAREDCGTVIGGAFAWSGNFKLIFQKDYDGSVYVLGGLNPQAAEYKLNPGEKLETPEMLLTFSENGKGTVSRNFHRWARRFGMRNGQDLRLALLNSWEGAYFKFDEALLHGMMDNAARIGLEMFVLDDGWFGNKYPRDNDKAGLGDWEVNRKKLPNGMKGLADYANSKGLKFGLWMEPEMVNPASELAEKHPEWIVQRPGREPQLQRNQRLLDLSNPKVQEHLFQTVDRVLTETPNIAYIKWDCNLHVQDVGSTWLPKEEQESFYVRYTKGLYSVYDRLQAKHPKVVWQVCASGGGRVDYGALKYHHEFWASDDTDPYERIFIQYGFNHVYPALATAAHVSASPNHQTGRITPLKFRFDVAMTGRLGMELQPKDLAPEEFEFARQAIQTYKEIRPIVQSGDLYRLRSPYEPGGYSALMYVSENKSEAVVFMFSLEHHARGVEPRFWLQGLAPSRQYKLTELNVSKSTFWGNNKTFTGDFLMKAGVNPPLKREYESAVYRLKAN